MEDYMKNRMSEEELLKAYQQLSNEEKSVVEPEQPPLEMEQQQEMQQPQIDPRLEAAREQRDKMNLYSNLLSGFQQLATAPSDARPDYRVADALRQQGQQAVEDVRTNQQLERQAQQDEMQMDRNELAKKLGEIQIGDKTLELTNLEKTSDPSSDESKFAQDLFLEHMKDQGRQLTPEQEANIRKQSARSLHSNSKFLQDKTVDLMQQQRLKIQQDRLELAKKRMGLQEREQDQRDVQEERRKMSFAKSYRDKMLSDPRFKDLKKQEQAFQQIPAIQEAAEEGNEVAVSSIGTRMARAMGEVGVLTDADVVRYLGNQSYGRKILDWYNRGMKGQIPVETGQDMQEVSQIMQDIVSTQVLPVYEEYASSLLATYPGDIEPEKALEILGAPGYVKPVFKDAERRLNKETPKADKEEKAPESEMVRMRIPDGRIKMIPKDKVEQAKQAGAEEL
jgi:hypothetical protein